MHSGADLEGSIISQSILYRAIKWIICKLCMFYRESAFHHIMASISCMLKSWFDGSKLWRFIRKSENSGRFFKYSLFYKIIQGVINLCVAGVRKAVALFRSAYECSVLYRLLDWPATHLEIVIGTAILIHTIIPHERWHNQYTLLLVFCIFVLYLVRLVHDGSCSVDIRNVDVALVIFALSTLLATITSIAPRASLRAFSFYAVMFLMVFIMVNILETEQQIKSLMNMIIAAVVLVSIYGIWQYVNKIPVDPRMVDLRYSRGVSRVFSTMGNPNDYAAYLLLTIPYFIVALLESKSKKMKLFLSALTILVLVNLVLTSTRAAWIAFAIGVFVFVFLKNRRLIPLLIVVGVVSIPFLPETIISRLSSVGKDSSSLYRIDIWKSSLAMLKDYWITGIGLGPEAAMSLFAKYSRMQTPAHSHMLPIEIWLEMGLAGIGSFIWFVARMVKKGFISVYSTKNTFLNSLIAASVASYAAILAMGLTDYVLFYPRTMNMFWFNTGIFIAAVNMVLSGKASEDASVIRL